MAQLGPPIWLAALPLPATFLDPSSRQLLGLILTLTSGLSLGHSQVGQGSLSPGQVYQGGASVR